MDKYYSSAFSNLKNLQCLIFKKSCTDNIIHILAKNCFATLKVKIQWYWIRFWFLVFVFISETWCGGLGMGYQWKHSFSGQYEAERAQYIKMLYKCQRCRCNFAEHEESPGHWWRDSICGCSRIPRWDNPNLSRTTQETENWRFSSKYLNLSFFEPPPNFDNLNVRLHKCLLA